VQPDQVFVHKVEDLRARSDPRCLRTVEHPDYEVLMAAPLLRELLMGSPPLIHLVNRERRQKIFFEVGSMPAYEAAVLEHSPVFFARVDGFYPGQSPPAAIVNSINLNQLLGETIMVVQGKNISVRDLIDYVSNAAGAVHFGDPTKHSRATLADVEKELGLGGLDAPLRCLLGIGQVVAAGLSPLLSSIKEGA
jgi:hypothetical protein